MRSRASSLARSIELRSSRTFPGQSCACSAAAASSLNCKSPPRKCPGKRQNIGRPVGQRQHGNIDHIEAVVEVFAKAPLADQRGQIGIGGAQDPHLRDACLARAQHFELARLQHAQQFDLAGQRQVADLIQEQSAAVGGLEAPRARAVGSRVGPSFRAEQFRLDELGGNRAAVHGDKWTRAYGRVGMHDLRNALLAGAVRARDQHSNIGASDAAGEFHDALHGIGGEDDAAKIVLLRQTLAPAALLCLQPLLLSGGLRQFQQVLDGRQQLVVVPGLADVIRGARFHQLHGGLQMRPGSQ